MRLQQAFQINPGDVVSIIGAGGKTSLLIGLGYELMEEGWRVLATATTRLTHDQLNLFPAAIPVRAGADAISNALNDHRFVLLYERIEHDQAVGVNPRAVQQLLDRVDSDVLLVEADDSGSKLLKAPFSGEPIIPDGTSLVIPVASMGVIGHPLDARHVYNPEAISVRYGFPMGAEIKSPWLAQIMRDEALGLSGVPDGVRVVGFLNQTPEKGYGRIRARVIARLALRSSRMHGIALGEVRGAEPVHELHRPVGAVILAAGMSTRMGQHKILMPWSDGHSIIEHIIHQLFKARIDPITVVTGHKAKEVKALLKPLDVNIVYNRGYRTGEMLSSVKAGLRAMPDHTAAALIVLGDQPRIQAKVLYQLLNAYALGHGDLIIPSYDKRRGHPLLLGRRYWPEMLSLPRDGAPRDLINTHADAIHYVTANNDSVLRDVDTPRDYEEERWKAGLGRFKP